MYSIYLKKAHTPKLLKKLVEDTAKVVKTAQKYLGFDSIVHSGISGASIAFPVSYLTGIPVVTVRKNSDLTHGNKIEGEGNFSSYVILDDFIASGKTLKRIINTIDSEFPYYKCTGVIFYDQIVTYDEIIERFENAGIDLPFYIVGIENIGDRKCQT